MRKSKINATVKMLNRHNLKFKKVRNDESELHIKGTPFEVHLTNQYYYVVNNNARVGYFLTPHFTTIEETENYLLEQLGLLGR